MSLSQSIKYRFLKRKKRAAFKHLVLLKKPADYAKILILIEKPSESLASQAAAIFKHAEINLLSERSEKEDHSNQFRYTVHPADFNLTGTLKNDKLNKLILTEFDLIIDLSGNSVLLNYLLKQLRATLTIGPMHSENQELYDLFFEKKSDHTEFLDQIQKQLNLLTKA